MNRATSFILDVARQLKTQRVTDAAGALAFTTLLSFVPILVAVLALFSISPWLGDFQFAVMNFVVNNMVPANYPVIANYLVEFTQKAQTLTWPSLAVMLVTALFFMAKIDTHLNAFFDNHNSTLSKTHRLLMYLLVGISGPLLLGASLTLVNDPMLSNTLVLMGFIGLFKWGPHEPVQWRSAIAGSLWVAVGLFVIQTGFVYYVKWFPSYSLIYGAFAALPLFLIWLYSIWLVILTGASITSVINRRL